jgi:hypothetical protein
MIPIARSPVDHQIQRALMEYRFEGFSPAAFDALARLRKNPTVDQLRADRGRIRLHVQEPFARYRDDLVVHWVLPNQLPFETERGVFSRLPKNDFGTGGAHHHLWMAFYRPPRRRLTDLQLSHGLHPEGFALGLYLGAYAGDAFRAARARMLAESGEALGLLNELMGSGYAFSYSTHVAKQTDDPTFAEALDAVPAGLARANGIWLRKMIPNQDVIAMGSDLVATSIAAMNELWPLYRWLDGASMGEGPRP